MTSPTRPDILLAAAWFVTAMVVGPLGWLLFALSESSDDRVLGASLGVCGLLAAALGAGLVSGVPGLRRWSLGLSAVLVVLGALAALVQLTSETVFVADALLVGVPPVVTGVLTALLARRRR